MAEPVEQRDYFKQLVIQQLSVADISAASLDWKPHEYSIKNAQTPLAIIANQPEVQLSMSPSNDAKVVAATVIPAIRRMLTVAKERRLTTEIPAVHCTVHVQGGTGHEFPVFQLYQWLYTNEIAPPSFEFTISQ